MKDNLKIKVCGMRDPENISSVAALKPDYLGFIFYSRSARFVGEDPTMLFSRIRAQVGDARLTGVFVDASVSEILETAEKYGLHTVQLHGAERPETCEALQTSGLEVIKAFGIDADFDFSMLDNYQTVCQFFLFDTRTAAHGGSGSTFDWNILEKYRLHKPYFLSGGLALENIEQIKTLEDERLRGVDLNSRFEESPGIKDIDRLKQAFKLLRISERV